MQCSDRAAADYAARQAIREESISTPAGNVRVGDVVTYSPFGGGRREVTVDAVYDDVKNGRPGFDGRVTDDDFGAWGYADQVEHVVPREDIR